MSCSRVWFRVGLLAILVCASSFLVAQTKHASSVARAQAAAPGTRTLLDAHNCYPYDGRWTDRINRALSSGTPLAIEQDLTLYTDPQTGVSAVVVSHDAKPVGTEPSLRDHFFERIRPIMQAAVDKGDRTNWPLITLNLEFKSQSPELLQALWNILGDYKPWLTTAVRGENPEVMQQLRVGPLLVLTGESNVLQSFFYDRLPLGEDLRIFGAAHVKGKDPLAPPEALVPDRADNYRRWWNNPWSVVESGGQRNAGEWTKEDATRLDSLVRHAHSSGYWIRFYTLDGGPEETLKQNGWFSGYNFGSLSAAEVRWKAAQDAGVDFVASDQYEQLGDYLRTHKQKPQAAAQ